MSQRSTDLSNRFHSLLHRIDDHGVGPVAKGDVLGWHVAPCDITQVDEPFRDLTSAIEGLEQLHREAKRVDDPWLQPTVLAVATLLRYFNGEKPNMQDLVKNTFGVNLPVATPEMIKAADERAEKAFREAFPGFAYNLEGVGRALATVRANQPSERTMKNRTRKLVEWLATEAGVKQFPFDIRPIDGTRQSSVALASVSTTRDGRIRYGFNPNADHTKQPGVFDVLDAHEAMHILQLFGLKTSLDSRRLPPSLRQLTHFAPYQPVLEGMGESAPVLHPGLMERLGKVEQWRVRDRQLLYLVWGAVLSRIDDPSYSVDDALNDLNNCSPDPYRSSSRRPSLQAIKDGNPYARLFRAVYALGIYGADKIAQRGEEVSRGFLLDSFRGPISAQQMLAVANRKDLPVVRSPSPIAAGL